MAWYSAELCVISSTRIATPPSKYGFAGGTRNGGPLQLKAPGLRGSPVVIRTNAVESRIKCGTKSNTRKAEG